MSDRDDLLAAMYDDETESPKLPPDNGDQRVRRIRVGIVEYEVPTVAYVQYLEQLVMQQSVRLEQQAREIGRLEASLFGTRNFVRRHSDLLYDLRSELSRKADHV